MKCENDQQRHIFQRVSKQLLRRADRLLRRLLSCHPETIDVKKELDLLDLRTRWSQRRVVVIVFGYHNDRSCTTIQKTGSQERPTQPSKAVDLSSLNIEQVNELFHCSSGGRRIVRSPLGKQTAGKQMPHEVLCECWS